MYTVRAYIKKDLPDNVAFLFAETLADIALSSSAIRENRKHTMPWVLEWLVEDAPDAAHVVACLSLQAAAHNLDDLGIDSTNIEISETPNLNWLKESYKSFEPFSIGPFFIHGTHFEGDVPASQMGLKIDAATAFGSGEHETTRGCLEAMLDLKGKGICPWNVLDMGTGSGILAIAAWKLWKTPILAIDNQEESVRMTKHHTELNDIELGAAAISCACGDGFNTTAADKKKPYELILANILAGPVIEMAPDLVRVLDDHGYCVLSGMLVEQADLVASAYEGEGLTLKKRYDIGEWTTLTLQKP